MSVLTAARAMCAAGWCPDHFAEDKYGNLLTQKDIAKAAKYSIIGALYTAAGDDPGGHKRGPAANALYAACGERSLIAWEDRLGRTQEQVLALFDKAIEAMEGT